MIFLSGEFIERTGRRERRHASDLRIAEFLRGRVAEAKTVEEETLLGFVRRNRGLAARFGITSEQGVARFCLVQVVYGGAAERDPGVASYLMRPDGDPEEDIRRLVDTLARLSAPDGGA
ncbi:MAG: hypothetical protein ACU0CC_15990 [Sagittula sp.]|jgi:hypothetical protein|uniref:hypothetical protein n=1 Tax=unclassified Sagittula TaxID=2624628 RepID=UPI000C2CFF3C|nr:MULTISPECIES: hypothetical protein [unclassified Sagittula]AUC53405.1 hypothetical protein CDO87_09445 [Sagittula sp. P11]WHZ35011.1 hypothetical protein QNI11_20565 [Sagittula sp. MA-2]